MSVWQGIDRDAFDRDLAVLCKNDKFQNAEQFPALLPHTRCEVGDVSSAIVARVECQLADDCAFLASWTTWPRHVASSTVQQKSNPDRVCISIAANQGIDRRVKAGFEALVSILERRARRGEEP